MATQKFLQSNLDPTKLLSVDIDDITTGTERVVTFPDQNLDLGISGMATVTAASGDYILVLDATDGQIKKVDAVDFISSGGVTFQGEWDASTGVFPGGGTAQQGDLYVVSVAGTVDTVEFTIGDSLYAKVNNASTGTFVGNWVKVDAADQVNSVFGRTGSVVATAGDYTASQITNVAAGNISAVTVQNAINELDTEKLGTALASAQIYVGNVGGVATAVAMSGHVTISNTGVTTVQSATDAQLGVVELATNAEVITGTSTTLVVTADSLDNYITQLIGNVSGQVDLDAFTGGTIPDNSSVKQALQALETAVEASGTATLADGSIWVGNVSNVQQSRVPSGDVTIDNTGVFTVVSASITVAGKVELATTAEVTTGTDDARAVTPLGLASNYTLTTDLASTANAKGASLIGIEDVGAIITATTVEGALAELAAGKLNIPGTLQDYTVSNKTTTRTIDANSITLQQLADVVASVIDDLIAAGLIQ